MTIHKTFSKNDLQSFKDRVYDYYNTNKRLFVWRNTDNTYYVAVSEIMLQQTQTHRVVEKFDQWISEFPTVESLAKAPQDRVIATWQGLGYNRRALALKQLAERIVQEYNGKIPNDPDLLVTFKGVGPYTAASICTFAFNRATIFIETNIRAVYIHEFFPEEKEVHDKQLMPLIEQTLDKKEPREWYYALMDYGVMLKKTLKNPSRKSAHHTKQSKFEGSDRQVRGAILKLLISDRSLSEQDFIQSIARDENKIKQILSSLEREGFIRYSKGYYYLST
jgi:A/G-specific adenine glycosylase